LLELKRGWPEMPGQSRGQLITRRKKELLKKGYPPGIVDLAMDWALNSASGMAAYVTQQDLSDDNDNDVEKTTVLFLPRYLKDCENWIQAFGHRPTS